MEGVEHRPPSGKAPIIVRFASAWVRDHAPDDAVVSNTAAEHFPQLLAIATPGPIFFLGDVPEGMKQATEQMQLGGEFGTHASGFDR